MAAGSLVQLVAIEAKCYEETAWRTGPGRASDLLPPDGMHDDGSPSVDILIVDDDAHVRVLRETLENAGLTCHVEEDGLRAFGWLRSDEHRCRLILLDMATPRINGWQFLELRARDPKMSALPVVVFSAMPLERLEGLQVNAIVRKPASPGRLVAAIRKNLDQS
jgi:CheY-like chemotaxis protein